ncbi:hypothetical protein GGX14DRAFT_471971 [Mycena pura]|uniref:Uncharacterized protein n=1 Tax=Mycena pura TaxID=153505 RepID=A0AAD6UXR9_9AGAR|nr:hypothetical protein GGX14DRAFT_471971 [Mycena pura]
MPRRSPPTSLRLVQGPVPPRSVPRHTLPSVPRPTFSQPAQVARGAAPRQAAQEDPHFAGKFKALPEIVIPPNSSLPTVVLSATSPSSRGSRRGPWDHSGSIQTPIDMGSLLAPLKPVALA